MSSTLETPERPALLLSGIDSLYVGYFHSDLQWDADVEHRLSGLRLGQW